MLIDTHSHLNFTHFDKDREQLIKSCLRNKIWMINVGTNFKSSKKAVEIAEKYKQGVWAAVGLHPINIIQNSKFKIQNAKCKIEDVLEENFDYQKYKDLARNEKVVAIGEIGLDYWSKPKTKSRQAKFKQKQKEIFFQQLNLARELGKPVIFHCRVAHEDLLEILNETMKQWSNGAIRGVIHCFTGSWEQAKKYLEMGFYLGFNGILFKIDLTEVIQKTPLERILLETDCPFLPPPSFFFFREKYSSRSRICGSGDCQDKRRKF